MAETPHVNPEEMARLLRANVQKQRPRKLRTFLILLVVLAGPVALLAWWAWPRPPLPRLMVIAFDQVALAGETVPLHGRLIPQDVTLTPPDLRGLEIFFEDLNVLARPGETGRRLQTQSASNGDATVPWPAPADAAVVDFKVAFTEARQHYHAEDRGRLFTWKAATPVMVVEVAALARAGPDAWRTGPIGLIAAQDGADKALQAAHQRHCQVVYMAAGAGSPLVYRKMRGWVETKALERGLFPVGPVLGQLPEGGAAPSAALWIEPVGRVKHWFGPPLMAVAKDPRLAEVLHAAGATVFMVGEAEDTPAGITRLPSWTDLAEHLSKEEPAPSR
jgi:hypothetical protein